MYVSEAAKVLDGHWSGPDARFSGCGIDTRSLERGMLFVALKGEQSDGHQYIKAACEKGAVAVLVEKHSDQKVPAIIVPDARKALGELARLWRAKFDLPVIGITGSNGKTTVKEMLGHILKNAGDTLITRGNYNNDLGLPLTLSGLDQWHKFAVLEMGANHPGEIGVLGQIAKPTIGVVTQCASAHLEGFGSLDKVAQTKGELYESLPENGVAIINIDDQYAGLWKEMAGGRPVITFGLNNQADVSAQWNTRTTGSCITMTTPVGRFDVHLQLAGKHNVMNALAATATALSMEIPVESIQKGLEAMSAVKGRLQLLSGLNGSSLIDDTYNANPTSMKAAIDVLSSYHGERYFVMGDMGELGQDEVNLHKEMGEYAKRKGVQHLLACGSLSRHAIEGFGSGAEYFESKQQIVTALSRQINQQSVVLVKGSRYTKMEDVVEALKGGEH